jgi:hypothetical protein
MAPLHKRAVRDAGHVLTHKNTILKNGVFVCFSFVRPERIELSTNPWQGLIIPLNHGRKYAVLELF